VENALVQFKVGDKVIYPNHGIGIVEKIQNREIGGAAKSYLTLRILSNSSTVMIPVENALTVGLRRMLSKGDCETVLDDLRRPDASVTGDWKGRFAENSDKMRSGEVVKVAEVLKSLAFLSASKTLSYREKKMLDRARFLVISELAEATQRPLEEIELEVDQAIAVTERDGPDH
jgi:CarD family transcriptional regulator